MDCIQNPQGIILTNPTDIANEIYRTQQSSFQRQAPNCDDIVDHPITCLCAIRKYPWHTQDGLILDKRGPRRPQITAQFTRAIYDKCVKRLTKGKAPGPDNISNDTIKTLPPQCHDLIFFFSATAINNVKSLHTGSTVEPSCSTKKKTPHNWPTTDQSR